MKILVIEDTYRHQESARQTLSDHDLTIVGSFDEAMKHLGNEYVTEENGQRVQKRGEFGDFDAVLSDLKLPMSEWQLGDDQHDPEELVSYGMQIAFSVAMKEVPFIVVATDQDHHDGPIAASLDYLKDEQEAALGTARVHPHTFTIDDSVCQIRHAKKIVWEDAENEEDKVHAKDWGTMLDDLIEDASE